MADLYVASTGSNTAPYDTWAKAATAPLTATDAAVAGDTIYQHAETFTLSGATTFTLLENVRWICTNDKVNEPPLTESSAGIIDGSTGSNFNVAVVGGPAYVKGFTFKQGLSSSASSLSLANTDLDAIDMEDCVFWMVGSGASCNMGASLTTSVRFQITLKNCSFKANSTAHGLGIFGRVKLIGGTYPDGSGTIPTTLFKTNTRVTDFVADGVDFSAQSTGTMFAAPSAGAAKFILSQCKLGASTLSAALTVAGSEFFLYDCATADTHYHIAHYSYTGSTTVSTAIYCNDGAEYNIAGDKCSLVVAGNANTSRANPYISPWFSRYNEATSAITPELEILRDGSASAFTDIEVWSEWLLKTAGGSPLATLYNDYGGHLSTGAAQGNGVGLAGWTGESGTAWSGKLECPSVTPAEIGHISARVVVAGNHTVYVDPSIRGV